MKILITLCARGGSKGIPGKNIRPLNGKPLIAYSIETAKKFAEKYDATIALSTDSLEIIAVCENYGLSTEYIRPEILASDTAGKIDALKDVLEYQENKTGIKFDYLLDLDVTAPLRTLQDLEEAFDIILKDADANNLYSVSPGHKNPYFNMVEQKADGYYAVSKTPITPIKSRQTAPKVYELNASFYFYRRSFFEKGYVTTLTDKSLIYEVNHTCFDLDEELDFEFLSFLLKENKLDFKI